MFERKVAKVRRYLEEFDDLAKAWDYFLIMVEHSPQFIQACEVVKQHQLLERLITELLLSKTAIKKPYQFLITSYQDYFYHGTVVTKSNQNISFMFFQDILRGCVSIGSLFDEQVDYYRFSGFMTRLH